MGTRLEEILARTRDFEKPVELKPVKRPLQEMDIYDVHAVMPFVMDAIDTPDNYDIWIGKQLLVDLTPMQTLSVLRKVKGQLMREVNEVQQEIDRIEFLESPAEPFSENSWKKPLPAPWQPQYYELQPRMERKR